MADRKQLEDRLKEIGCNFRFFARPEIRELANVLMPNELVQHCVIGQYKGVRFIGSHRSASTSDR